MDGGPLSPLSKVNLRWTTINLDFVVLVVLGACMHSNSKSRTGLELVYSIDYSPGSSLPFIALHTAAAGWCSRFIHLTAWSTEDAFYSPPKNEERLGLCPRVVLWTLPSVRIIRITIISRCYNYNNYKRATSSSGCTMKPFGSFLGSSKLNHIILRVYIGINELWVPDGQFPFEWTHSFKHRQSPGWTGPESQATWVRVNLFFSKMCVNINCSGIDCEQRMKTLTWCKEKKVRLDFIKFRACLDAEQARE